MAKRDARLDAIKYQEMLKAQQSKKRATEEQAKEEVDKLSKLVAALRQMGAQGGEAEPELDQANAALREKDWTRAYNAAGTGIAAAQRAAAAAARPQVEAAVQKVYAVENIGVPSDELMPMVQEARAMVEQGRFLEALRKAQELRGKALQLGRAQMEDAIASLNEMLEDDRRKGVNTTAPGQLLDRARREMASGDVDFNAVIDLITVQAQVAREAALRGEQTLEPQEGAPAFAPIEAEDKEALKRAIEEAFKVANAEIQTARSLKGNVAAADKELARAKSAFDADDLKSARAGGRRSIVAAQAAARKAVYNLLLDASADVRKLRLAGVNVTEPRKHLATAKARLAEGSFREAFTILDDLIKRTNAMREEQQKIIKEVDATYDQLLKLTDTLLVPTDAVEALEEARNHARRGDVERAQASLKRAMTTGREFWSAVGNSFFAATRDRVLESQKMGGRIAPTRAIFNRAKQALDEGRFQDAITTTFETVRTLQGPRPEYLDALTAATQKTLDLAIAEKLRVGNPAHEKALEESQELRSETTDTDEKKLGEAYAADLERHKALLDGIRYDFKGDQARYQRLVRRTLELENEVEEGKKIGTDMTRAEELLFNARSTITKRKFQQADELLKQIEADITQRKDARIDELLRDADTDLKHLRAGGVYVEDVEREVREARAQHANRNYEVAVDLIQDAISTALERQQDLESSRREIDRAESLIEQGGAYAADMGVAAALLDEARSLSREHDDRDARAIAAQAVGEAQTSLAKYIDLILEETEKEIDGAESEYGEFPEPRQRLHEARRLKENGEVGEALVTARDIAGGLRAALQTIQEIRAKIQLVESYIAWTSQYSKTIVMPHKLLEHAKERLEHRSLEASREAVGEALQKAEEAQKQFIRSLHREAFELIDEYEEKGVPLTAARNLMMQAQGLLETKSFQESYRVAVAAQETARKSFDVFQRTQRAVGELEEEVEALEGFGVDAGPLTALLEKASASFASEDYDGANAAVLQAQELAPALKARRADALEAEVAGKLEVARERKGLNTKKFREAFDHCVETRKSGDLSLALEMLLETQRDLGVALKESEAVEALLAALEARVSEFEKMGLDAKALQTGRQSGLKRLDGLDLKEGTSILKRTLKAAEKDAAAFAAARIDAVIQEALAMRLRGYPSEGVIKAAEAGSEALLGGAFVEAVQASAQGAEVLKALQPRVDGVRRDLSRGRHAARLLQDGFGVEAPDAAYLDEAERTMLDGDLDGAERESRSILDGLLQALGEKVRERMGKVEASLEAAAEKGAATAPVEEALKLASTALEQGLPEAAAHWTRVGARDALQCVKDVEAASRAVEQAAAVLEDTRAFGGSVAELEPKIGALRALLADRRHRLVLIEMGEIERAAAESKKARVDARKAEILSAIQRAAKLGLPQEGPRKALAAAERQTADLHFKEALATLDGLEAEVGETLTRHDEISAEFEEVLDLLESFIDLKVDFKSAVESRDHARAAIERFQLKEADELTTLFRKEVDGILTSHTLSRIQALLSAAGAAKGEGVVVPAIEEHARMADEELRSRNYREALVAVDQGLEKLTESKKRNAEVAKILKEGEAALQRAAPLKLDFGEVEASFAAARGKAQEGSYEEAKVDADYGASALRSQVAHEIERRVEALTSRIEEAAGLGVSIEPERAGLKKTREAAEAGEFTKLNEAQALIEQSLDRKLEERRLAFEAIETLKGLADQLEGLELEGGEFLADLKAAEKWVDAGDFKRALPAGASLVAKVTERMKARVAAAIADTQAVLKLCAASSIETGAAQDEVARSRALEKSGDYLGAYAAARGAEKAAYENKDRHDRASQFMRFLDDNMAVAKAFKVDAADIEAFRAQAKDAFDFQSYEEAASTSLEALSKLNSHLKDAFGQRKVELDQQVEELEMGGANVSLLRKEVDLAASLAENGDFLSAEVTLSATEKRVAKLGAEFAGAKDGQERLQALIDVADALGVDGSVARKGAQHAQGAFDEGKYNDCRRVALVARADLAKACAGEVEKRIDAASKALEALDASGVPTAALTDLLERGMGELLDEDFAGAFATAREVVEAAETQRRAHEAAREAIRAARRLLKVAEGLKADAEAGREMLTQAEQLFASGDFEACEGAAAESREALGGAAAASAGAAIQLAEKDLAAFVKGGVQCPPAQDCIERSRAALDLTDYLGSIRFAARAREVALDAKRQMAETEKLLEDLSHGLDRAEGLVETTEEERALVRNARDAFEGGQMYPAAQMAREARAALEKRAREGAERTSREVHGVLESVAKLGGDSAPALGELLATEKALAESRALDALEAAMATRTRARELLGEAIQGRAAEARELVDAVGAAGVEVKGAAAPFEALEAAAEALDAEAAMAHLAKVRESVDAAVKAQAERVLATVQRASDHRFFKAGAGAREAAAWKATSGELRALLSKGDYTKVLEGLAAAQEQVESGVANVVAERLVEIDAIRDAYAGRREPTPEERAGYDVVAAAADRGRASLEDLDAADKLDAQLRDWASKFTVESINRIKRDMMTFEDKATVEKLRVLVAAAEKARANPAMALSKTYELLDGALELMSARAKDMLALADKQVAVAHAVEADATALQDFADRGHAALEEGKVSEAIEFAENVLKEGARLFDAQVTESLKKVKVDYEAAPEGKAKADAKRLIAESLQARQNKDFEVAYDFARKAREALLAEAREAAEVDIKALLELVSELEGEGVDSEAFRESIEGVRQAFDEWDTQGARARLVEVGRLIKERHREWSEAAASLAKLQERFDRATAAKIDVGDLGARLEQGRRRLKESDFAGVKKDAEGIAQKLNDLLSAKVKALIASAQAKVKHNKNLEIDSGAAEELLASAQKMLAGKDIEGAFDAASRAIGEADSAKEVTKQVRAFGEQGTELLERAAEGGVTLSPEQEQIIFDAAKGRLRPGMKPAQLEQLIQAIREQVGVGGPRVELSFAVGEPPVVNRTNNAVLEISNRGDAPATDFAISFSGDASVKVVGRAPSSVEPGGHEDLELQVISRRMGECAVRVLVVYKDATTGETKRRTERRWLTFFDPTDTTSVEQFARREEKCLICVGTIPPTERLKVCECQSTFHLHCAAGLKDCPKCGRSLAES